MSHIQDNIQNFLEEMFIHMSAAMNLQYDQTILQPHSINITTIYFYYLSVLEHDSNFWQEDFLLNIEKTVYRRFVFKNDIFHHNSDSDTLLEQHRYNEKYIP